MQAMAGKTLTRAEAKQWFIDSGLSITSWAEKLGFPREQVYGVLSGRLQGRRGTAHQIAVALGIKFKPSPNTKPGPYFPPEEISRKRSP